MKIEFSRHARRRAKLYRIPESTVEAIVSEKCRPEGQHELVVDVPEMRYPSKVVVVVEGDVCTVITNYPLKKAATK